MDELRIDEQLLNECLHLLAHDENMQHRGLRNLIEMIAMAGYRHRSNYRIVLYCGGAVADYDYKNGHFVCFKAPGGKTTMPVVKEFLLLVSFSVGRTGGGEYPLRKVIVAVVGDKP